MCYHGYLCQQSGGDVAMVTCLCNQSGGYVTMVTRVVDPWGVYVAGEYPVFLPDSVKSEEPLQQES